MKNKSASGASSTKEKSIVRIFDSGNYKLMIAGGVLILLGIVLMIGGKSPDPKVFNPQEVYSFRRITLAPILIIAGLVVEIFAIMKKSAG
jgi:hypothetical protein